MDWVGRDGGQPGRVSAGTAVGWWKMAPSAEEFSDMVGSEWVGLSVCVFFLALARSEMESDPPAAAPR